MTTRTLLLCLLLLVPVEDSSELAHRAQSELYAARFESAANLYAKLIESEPDNAAAYYGRVRALIKAHHAPEAWDVADAALRRNPDTELREAAAGLADYRRGKLNQAEKDFVAALRLNRDSPEAMAGLAAVYSAVSLSKKASDLRVRAYQLAPGDPELMMAYANTLKGAEHIAALERVLAVYDSASEQARNLRAHVAADKALGDRKLRRLISPYAPTRIRLTRITDGKALRGIGIRAKLNGKHEITLLLDTGASGIAISPKTAERAGLELLTDHSVDAKGIGDQDPQNSYAYLASEVQMGDAVFADFPVEAFRSAKSADFDGLIGADVFQRFIVSIDFPLLNLELDPRKDLNHLDTEDFVDRHEAPVAGFQRVYRVGNHLIIPTMINNKGAVLFLVDSGSNSNLIDTRTAREFTKVDKDNGATVRGLQGKVTDISRARNISMMFAGFRYDNPDLISIPLDKMSDAMGVEIGGVLGMPILSQLRLTIDYWDGSIRLDHRR